MAADVLLPGVAVQPLHAGIGDLLQTGLRLAVGSREDKVGRSHAVDSGQPAVPVQLLKMLLPRTVGFDLCPAVRGRHFLDRVLLRMLQLQGVVQLPDLELPVGEVPAEGIHQDKLAPLIDDAYAVFRQPGDLSVDVRLRGILYGFSLIPDSLRLPQPEGAG